MDDNVIDHRVPLWVIPGAAATKASHVIDLENFLFNVKAVLKGPEVKPEGDH